MLKGIPKVLTPEMLKILCEMGHDDEIVIADAHFPAERWESVLFSTHVLVHRRWWKPL